MLHLTFQDQITRHKNPVKQPKLHVAIKTQPTMLRPSPLITDPSETSLVKAKI